MGGCGNEQTRKWLRLIIRSHWQPERTCLNVFVISLVMYGPFNCCKRSDEFYGWLVLGAVAKSQQGNAVRTIPKAQIRT